MTGLDGLCGLDGLDGLAASVGFWPRPHPAISDGREW
jgi:hypothetical protein